MIRPLLDRATDRIGAVSSGEITAIQVDIREIDLGVEHQDREEGVFGEEDVSYEIFLREIIGWKPGRVKLQPLGDVFIPFSVYPSE